MKQYQLQLNWLYNDGRYIVGDDEWIHVFHPVIFTDSTVKRSGVAITYSELDLLWICWCDETTTGTTRFETVEDFEKEFLSLPRWATTRYAVCELPDGLDENDPTKKLVFFDCRTGQQLLQPAPDGSSCFKPLPGREAEVERLYNGIFPMMGNEDFHIG